MNGEVTLVGLDVGTTTTSAVVASARIVRHQATGRMQLGDVRERFRSPMVFTPVTPDDQLDVAALSSLVRGWLSDAGAAGEQPFGGGALLTGLAARRENAAAVIELSRDLLGDGLVATADDPRLESWLAFMGSAARLSRQHADRSVLNLDIGGGTTNLALGRNGEVLRTGSLFVGARHIQVVPGTYRIERVSPQAKALLKELGIAADAGSTLTPDEVEAVLDWQIELLRAAMRGDRARLQEDPLAAMHEEAALMLPENEAAGSRHEPIVTLSGGVGALVYAHLAGRSAPPPPLLRGRPAGLATTEKGRGEERNGQSWPGTTAFGDLGIALAQRLATTSPWREHFLSFQPDNGGRATVLGLLRHATEVSGHSLFLPNPTVLPLHNLPILGHLHEKTSAAELRGWLALAAQCPRGACLKASLTTVTPDAVRALGTLLAAGLQEAQLRDLPLVILARENFGKTLGQYATGWGLHPANLVVIDELDDRDGQYAHIGACAQQVVPVAIYGLN